MDPWSSDPIAHTVASASHCEYRRIVPTVSDSTEDLETPRARGGTHDCVSLSDSRAAGVVQRVPQSRPSDKGLACSIDERTGDGESGLDLFLRNPFPTEEWSYWIGDRLLGVGYVDVLAEGLSAIYFFHDPREHKRSLGTLNILHMIDAAGRRGLSHVYLAPYVKGCRSWNTRLGSGRTRCSQPRLGGVHRVAPSRIWDAVQESGAASHVRAVAGRWQDFQRDVRGVESRTGSTHLPERVRQRAKTTRRAQGNGHRSGRWEGSDDGPFTGTRAPIRFNTTLNCRVLSGLTSFEVTFGTWTAPSSSRSSHGSVLAGRRQRGAERLIESRNRQAATGVAPMAGRSSPRQHRQHAEEGWRRRPRARRRATGRLHSSHAMHHTLRDCLVLLGCWADTGVAAAQPCPATGVSLQIWAPTAHASSPIAPPPPPATRSVD